MIRKEQFLGFIGAILSLISVVAACYVLLSAIKLRKQISKLKDNYNSQSQHGRLFLIESVQCLALCDVVLESLWLWIFLSMSMPNKIGKLSDSLPNIGCIIRGFLMNLFDTAGMSWNGIIAFNVLRILIFKHRLNKLTTELKWYHIYVWSLSFTASIIPFFGDAYGKVDNDNAYFQCWINNTYYQLCFYIPAILYWLIALILMIYVIYLRIFNIIPKLNMKLIYFTAVFTFIWICMIIERVYSIFNIKHNNHVPVSLLWIHHIAAASIGLGNAIVWGTNPTFHNNEINSRMSQTELIQSNLSNSTL